MKNKTNNIDRIVTILENEYNYSNSAEKKSCIDKKNEPIPWFTYSAIFFLEQLNLSEKLIFEWGSGNSSLFFAKRAKTVTSIEHDPQWFETLLIQRKDNMELRFCEMGENYTNAIHYNDVEYDIISIDGEITTRLECAKQAIKKLKTNGLIILDNSDWLSNTAAFLRTQGLMQVDFGGIGPINPYMWCTSFFFTRNFIPEPINYKQPSFIPGGLRNIRD
jgi:hypothetical protein